MSFRVNPRVLQALYMKALDAGSSDGMRSQSAYRDGLLAELKATTLSPYIGDAIWAVYTSGRRNAMRQRRATTRPGAQTATAADLRAAMSEPLERLHGVRRPTPEDDFLR